VSGSLGGRTPIARPFVAPGPLPKLGTAEVGTPCVCDCTGAAVNGVFHGSGFVGVGGAGLNDHTDINPCGILCSSDMVVTLTIAALTPHGSGYAAASVYVAARIAGFASMFTWGTYVFGVKVTGGGAGTAQWQLYTDFGSGIPSNTAAGTVPAAGDVLELTVNGTSIVAKRNGVGVFSITDSTVGTDLDNRPTSYAGWSFTAAATSDVTVSNCSATAIC
jgi:hypothetical protein